MNKKILLILSLVLILGFSTCSQAQVRPELANMEPVAENEYLILYMDKTDTSLAILSKETDRIWTTNPLERGKARAGLKERISSQLNIIHDPARVTKENFSYSNQFDTYEIILIDNGVRVEYQFVEQWTASDYLPQLISADRFEELILSNLSGKEYDDIRSNYYLVQIRELEEDEEMDEIPGLDKVELMEEYTIVVLDEDYLAKEGELAELEAELEKLELELDGSEDQDILGEIDKLKTKMERLSKDLLWDKEDVTWHVLGLFVDNRADLDKMQDITEEHISSLLESPTYVRKNIARFTLPKLSEIVANIGYSPIDATEDHILNNINPSVPNLEIFEIPMEYRLDGKDFLVTIPCEEIYYPEKVFDFADFEKSFPLLFLEVLPFFSASSLDDSGYILVPDGSGALIYFNNGKLYAPTYNQVVYGRDFTEDPPGYQTSYGKQIHLPIFGLKNGDQAFLGIIEKGDAIAHIRADVSGRRDDYNKVFPRFHINKSGLINLDHGGSLDVYQPDIYRDDIQIRYMFFVDEEANYSQMAQGYQKYLVDRGVLTPIEESVPPFLLDVIGAFPRQEIRMGVPRTISYPATSFADLKEIFDTLSNDEIDRIHIRYSGWLKGGLEHIFPTTANIDKVLGTENEFKDLIRYIQGHGGIIYPDVGFVTAYQDKLTDGFSPTQDAVRGLNRLPVTAYDFNIATFARENMASGYVVSPRTIGTIIPKFMDDYKKYGSLGISFNQLGKQLNSDFRRAAGTMIHRQKAAEIIGDRLKEIAQTNRILVEGGNLYTLPYASTVINVPLEDSGYDIVDQRIPFYQMVVSGYLDYAGDPLNLVSDKEQHLLLSLETGALPLYTIASASSDVVKGTKYAQFYSFNFDDRLEEILDDYRKIYPVLNKVYGERFIEHELLEDGVTKSTYANGVSIIVNYNNYSIDYNGIVVEGKDIYLLEGDN